MTVTPDAVQTTLEEFIAMIPPDQREVLAAIADYLPESEE